jgi:hypothetical protein
MGVTVLSPVATDPALTVSGAHKIVMNFHLSPTPLSFTGENIRKDHRLRQLAAMGVPCFTALIGNHRVCPVVVSISENRRTPDNRFLHII